MKHRLFWLAICLALISTVALAQVGRVEGTVSLPGNHFEPAVGATVTLHHQADSLFTTTDNQGHFVFEQVSVGGWGAVATLSGYLPGQGQVFVMENHTAMLNLHLGTMPTGFGNVAGTVFLPNWGGPAVGATVTLTFDDTLTFTTTTGDSGHYVFEHIPTLRYNAQATLEGYQPAMSFVFVPDGHTAILNLFLGSLGTDVGGVDGIVRLPGIHGGPAGGATVTLRRFNHDSLVTTADDSGHFAFAEVPVGEWGIRATLEGYLAAEAPVWVMDGHVTHIQLTLRTEPTGGGAVEGTVTLANGSPALAAVDLAGNNHGAFYHTQTNMEGHFSFAHVQAGPYTISAMAMMHGFASAQIEVNDNMTTHVNLVLSDSGNGGHHHGDSLTVVDLQGTAIVVHPDSLHHPRRVLYFLDVDNDGTPDYRLAFGPPWYNPPSGAQRPENGDGITIHGGLLTYGQPPTVVVWEINGQFWRRPFNGHGGNGGGDHGHDGCDPDSVTRVELEGVAMLRTVGGFHGEMTLYGLNTDTDSLPEYALDFGRPDYDPGNGATRPANGDQISIVGGQVYCPNALLPVVIVYEINGQFWREPGDTLGLGPIDGLSVGGPTPVGAPVSYLTARNYPNPFNPSTIINYSIPSAGEVKLAIYDITGRKVADLVDQYQAAGNYAINFDGKALPSGIYFYRVSMGKLAFTNRMVLLK